MTEKRGWGFEDLECYQLALEVLREAYRVAGRLPDVERYSLAQQMRRAAASVVLNIAEGYGRYHYLDSLRSLDGYVRYVRRQRQGHTEYGDRLVQEQGPSYIAIPEPFEEQ